MLDSRDTMHCSSDDAPLRCEIELAHDTARVLPIGEIDLATVPLVEQRLEQARAAGVACVVLDLSATTFIDSTGLHLALAWHSEALTEGFHFVLVQGPEPVRRAMELTGIAPLLNFLG